MESIDEPQIQKDLFGDIINPAENLADDVVSNKKANKKILPPSRHILAETNLKLQELIMSF